MFLLAFETSKVVSTEAFVDTKLGVLSMRTIISYIDLELSVLRQASSFVMKLTSEKSIKCQSFWPNVLHFIEYRRLFLKSALVHHNDGCLSGTNLLCK